MRVLIGCEFSGTIRDKFASRGHEVLSCDLQPSDTQGAHYQGDIFNVIDYPWDLAIFHPPCTNTAVSGARHFAEKKADGSLYTSVSFFLKLEKRSKHIPHRAFEHPVSIMSTLWRKPDQIIQPWQFGHGETKTTCLWLFGLPRLLPTNIVSGRDDRIHKMPPSEERGRLRSITYEGIANAMVEQWPDCRH